MAQLHITAASLLTLKSCAAYSDVKKLTETEITKKSCRIYRVRVDDKGSNVYNLLTDTMVNC